MALPVDRRHAFSRLIPRPERRPCWQLAPRARILLAGSRAARASPWLSRPRLAERWLALAPTTLQSFMCLLPSRSRRGIAQPALPSGRVLSPVLELEGTSPPPPEA